MRRGAWVRGGGVGSWRPAVWGRGGVGAEPWGREEWGGGGGGRDRLLSVQLPLIDRLVSDAASLQQHPHRLPPAGGAAGWGRRGPRG